MLTTTVTGRITGSTRLASGQTKRLGASVAAAVSTAIVASWVLLALAGVAKTKVVMATRERMRFIAT
ncbi:hypothetical protein GCM10022268_19200 [Sphingomonas cynarae]|uniref:Uncharacterized protein n=1 Tax=Sphingomonas cynarae TaxID=930197 RepID=A0ABP7DXC3_9SPHN